MNPGDVACLMVEVGTTARRRLACGEDDEPVRFIVESTDEQCAVIRYADDEVELTVPVTDLIPVNPLS